MVERLPLDILEAIERAHRRFLDLSERIGRLIEQARHQEGEADVAELWARIDALRVELDEADAECDRLMAVHLDTLED